MYVDEYKDKQKNVFVTPALKCPVCIHSAEKGSLQWA